MSRLGFVLILGVLLTPPLFGAPLQVQRAAARGQNEPQQPNVQQRQQNQIQQLISIVYVSDFRQALKLTDDQFIKMGRFIQQFIQMRFTAAIERDNVNQQLDQLLSQPSPSQEAVRSLVTQKTRLDRGFGNMEPQFMERIVADLNTGQIPLFYDFNRRFFDEKLPGLIEQARAQTKTQAPPPQGRPNANPNRPQNGPNRGDAFRDQQNQQNR